jgi:hypothetical protein
VNGYFFQQDDRLFDALERNATARAVSSRKTGLPLIALVAPLF